MRPATYLIIATVLFSTGWRMACANEPDGVVKSVQGNELGIKPESHFLPTIGEKVKIFVTIPDVGEAAVGSAVITRIDNEQVYARVEKATGKIRPGQIVRSLAAATPEPPKPPDSPSEQRFLVVTSPTAKVMAGAKVVGQVRRGQRLPFAKQRGDWYFVEFRQDGRPIRGWVLGKHVRVEPARNKPAAGATVIEGWGSLFDPAGRARAVKKNGAVDLSVPGVYRDLWPEGGVNAPRILQPVKGDFSAQVKVTSPVNVTGLELAADRAPNAGSLFRAAVLLVWHDKDNFVRLERGSSRTRPHRWGYQVRERGKAPFARVGIVRPHGASWLRIQRKQGTFYAWYRQEGDSEWTAMEVRRPGFPDEVQVGVSLVNTTSEPFSVRFEDFVVKQEPTVP